MISRDWQSRARLGDWIKACAFLWAMMASSAALADEIYWVKYLTTLPLYGSPSQACAAIYPSTYVRVDPGPNSETYRCVVKSGTQNVYAANVVKLTKVSCPPGTVRNTVTGVCDPEPPCKTGPSYVLKFSYVNGTSTAKMPDRDGICLINVIEVLDCRTETVGGVTGTYCMMEVEKNGGIDEGPAPTNAPTGSNGTGSPTDPKTNMPPSSGSDPSGKCPAGTTVGGVDSSGTTICMGSGTSPTPPKAPPTTTTKAASTTTDPDTGATVTMQDKVQQNADGSTTTTTTTTTTAVDGGVTTKVDIVVSNTPTGSPGRTDGDPSDDKYDLCKKNPQLTICKNSSVGGTCGEVFCEGDAIQCATLRAAAAMECRDRQSHDDLLNSPLKALGDGAVAGTDRAGLPSYDKPTVFNVASSLDQSTFINGSSCFTDKTFTIQGHTVVMPFSQLCNYIIVFRYAIMVVGALVAFRILSGSMLKE